MTHKHIFISKGTLDCSRGRSERRLNAILDSQDKCLQNSLLSLPDTGEEQVFDSSHHSNTPFQASPVCLYSDFCLVKFMKESCISFENCQTHKYYERYKNIDLNGLRIGI